MAAGKKSGKVKDCKMNSIVAGIHLGDRESLATVLSPVGDVADRFSFPMNEEGYAFFAGRVPKGATIAFESTIMAYPISRALREHGYSDITVAHPKTLVEQHRGNYDEAIRLYNRSLEIERKLGNQSGIATTLGQLGRLAEEKGDLEAAEKHYEQALGIFEKLGEKPNIDLAKKDLERVRQMKHQS